MAILRKRKLKEGGYVYDVDFYYKGRRYRRSTKTADKRQATLIRDEIQGRISRGAFNISDYVEANVSLKDFARLYVVEHCAIEKTKGTTAIDEMALRDLMEHCGENTVMRTVSESMVRSFRAHLKNKKFRSRGSMVDRKLSNTTINMKMRSLRAAFNWAMGGDRHFVDSNVFTMVKQLPVEKREVRALAFSEVKQLLEFADTDGVRGRDFGRYLRFLLLTGCRRSEAVYMVWGDVDFANGFVSFRNTDSFQTKTKVDRTIPMSLELAEMLKEMYKECVVANESIRVFPYRKGYVTDLFAKYRRWAGFTGKVKLHGLRHTAAMVMRVKGVSVSDIGDILGHLDQSTTAIYIKAFPVLLRPAVEAVNLKQIMEAGQVQEKAVK